MRCQAGDERAFAELFERFASRTLRYLQRLIGDEAEDVQQQVWLSVYRHVSRLAAPAAFVTWLFRLTRHRAIDHLRQRRRSQELMDDVAMDAAANDSLLMASSGDDLESYGGLDVAEVMTAIGTLAPIHREVLTLRYQDDLSYADIANVTGCSVGTVKSRLYHAKRRLQDAIANTHHVDAI